MNSVHLLWVEQDEQAWSPHWTEHGHVTHRLTLSRPHRAWFLLHFLSQNGLKCNSQSLGTLEWTLLSSKACPRSCHAQHLLWLACASSSKYWECRELPASTSIRLSSLECREKQGKHTDRNWAEVVTNFAFRIWRYFRYHSVGFSKLLSWNFTLILLSPSGIYHPEPLRKQRYFHSPSLIHREVSVLGLTSPIFI